MKKLRKNILRAAVFLSALLILLMVYGWIYVSKQRSRVLNASANDVIATRKESVRPGDIYDTNGILLASSDRSGARTYQEDEQRRRAVAHVLGDTRGGVKNGVDSFMAWYLYGFEFSVIDDITNLFTAGMPKGDDVHLTIDSSLCTYISTFFPKGKSGAVVVLDYKTGATLAEMSFPDFDPLTVNYSGSASERAVFINNAVQMLKAPGSTFKIITAAAALENTAGIDTWNYLCEGYMTADGKAVTCSGTNLSTGKISAHGALTLETAFSKSCNSAFAELALNMGDSKLKETAEKFGFNDHFLFSDMVVEDSVYPSRNRTPFEIAFTGAGQSALLTTPMHMCMVAAAVANNGVMMEPKLLKEAVSQKGSTRARMSPAVYRTVMTEQIAAVLKGYMRTTVQTGTGTAAAVPGHRICGKTGSAEMDGQENTDAWFVGFIDEEDFSYAVCVVIRDAGGGGTYAAPVAKKVFTYLTENCKKEK
ncbi:MAG: hypothetical protein CW338_01185 [Clostridiales bacterium]|nr:hypothetical protein [Clostridiales bacterium]